MSRESEAYTALQRAMESNTPDCQDMELFTADGLTPADTAVLTPICDACPLFELCSTYARIARPPAGFWAGKRYAPGGQRS